MRWIYISPHLDDAVFSAGGLIYEQVQHGVPAEIWTVMSGFPNHVELSPFAKSIHQQWGTSSARETIQVRRKENEVAAAVLGAKNRYLDFIDSLYRFGSGGQALYASSYSPLSREETDLPRKIAGEIVKHLLPDDVVICPLTLGGHIDHILVREAIDLLDLSPFYIADIPYLLDNPRSLWRKTLCMKESIHEISNDGLQYWMKAIRSYETQIKVEFESVDLMERKIITYWNKNKGIRLWKKR